MGRHVSLTLAVIDDDADVRSALARLLRSMGHNVRVFASAEEFEPEGAALDCLIVDVRLPGVSGLELAERLRTSSASLPIVLITGDSEWVARDSTRAADTPWVTKPFDEVTLMAAIDGAISSADGLRERRAP